MAGEPFEALRTPRHKCRHWGMPLVTCKECGHRVANSAPSCPSCGVFRSTQPPVITQVVAPERSGSILAMGVAALAFGVISMLGAWVPYLGMLTTPVAAMGLAIGGLGTLLAMLRGFRSIGLPLVATGLCAASIGIAMNMTKRASDAIGESARRFDQIRADAERKAAASKAEKLRESDDYVAKHVDLYDVQARYFDSLLEGRIPGVSFKLKNRGQRTLSRVQVNVQFEDSEGHVISEADFVPISEFSLDDNGRPLKPGFVWQIDAGSMFTAKSVPSEWCEGRVKARISSVSFIESNPSAPPR